MKFHGPISQRVGMASAVFQRQQKTPTYSDWYSYLSVDADEVYDRR